MHLTFPIERIGWVLLHFVWQATVLALLLAIALRAMRRSSSLIRYISACTILVLIAAAPVVTYVVLPQDRALSDRPIAVPDSVFHNWPVSYSKSLPAGVVPASSQHVSALHRMQDWLAPRMPWFVALWCMGAALMLTRHLGAWIYLQKLLRRSSVPLRESWARLNALTDRIGLKRHVLLLESTLLEVPATVGWMRPVVLLPASVLTGLSMDELEALVLHELAHIRRHDYLINVLQTIVETLLFYHPAVWWVSKQIRLDRENCCDDIAAAASSNAATYATALATIETLRPDSPRFAMGAAGGSLLDRIKRLTLPREIAVRRRHGAAVVSSLVAAALLLMVQTQALSSMILQHRVQTLSEMPTFGEAVYSIMEIPPRNDELLPAIAGVFGPLNKKEFADVTSPQVAHLIAVLNDGGDPDVLVDEAKPLMTAASRFSYQNRPEWKYGTYIQRQRLSADLWNEAQRACATDPQRASTLARGAILLTGQAVLDLEGIELVAIFREDAGRNIAQLSSTQIEEFDRYLQQMQSLIQLSSAHVISFSKDYASLEQASAQERRQLALSMFDAIDQLRQLAPQRMTVQWQVANLTQRLAHLPAAQEAGIDLRQAARQWTSALSQPQFTRWMGEAFTEELPKGLGAVARIVKSSDLHLRRAPTSHSVEQHSAIKKSRVEEGGGEPSSGSTLDRP